MADNAIPKEAEPLSPTRGEAEPLSPATPGSPGSWGSVGSLFSRRRLPKLSMNVKAVRNEQKVLSDATDEVRAQFDAKYEMFEVLGQGSSSLVKRGKVRESGLDVALKMVRTSDPETQQMARKEFDLISPLKHPNIIKVHDFFVTTGQTILVVELFTATELQDAVRQTAARRLCEETSRGFMSQLTEALNYLHQHRIIHRDVKPQNVLVSDCLSTLKLIDFNVARRLEEGGSLTMTGTAQYAAPEVLLGQSASDGVDVWAAGLCLYYMLAGKLPFRIEDFNSNVQEFGEFLMQNPVSFMGACWDEVSEPCLSLIRQCLAVKMSDRPAPMTLLKSEWLAGPQARRRAVGSGMFDTEDICKSMSFAHSPTQGYASSFTGRQVYASSFTGCQTLPVSVFETAPM